MGAELGAGTRSARSVGLWLTLLVVCGFGLRVLGLRRGLWYDEAWVLDSVRAASLHTMFFYRDWAQTTPPGVLLVLRSLRDVVGTAPETLRWVPWLCGVLTLALTARLSTRLLHGVFALPVVMILALSPEIIWYATEIKQYAFDLLCMTAVLYSGWLYIEQPSRARAGMWLLLFAALAVFSYTLVFVLPAVVVVAILLPADSPLMHRLRALWLPAALALLFCVLVYLVFARPNSGLPTMYAYWHKGFVESSGYSIAYFLRRVVAEQAAFLPFVVKSPLDVAVFLALAGGGVVGILRRWPGARGQALLVLLTLPPLTVLLANLVGFYPLAEFRLLYFLCVHVMLLLGMGLQWLTMQASGVLRARAWRTLVHSSVVLSVVLACGVGVINKRVATVHGLPPSATRLDMRAAVRFLHLQNDLERPVFVHVAFRQLFKEYQREFPVTSPVSYGAYGWPCCVPGKPWTSPEFNAADVGLDVDAAVRFIGVHTGYLLIRKSRSTVRDLEYDMYARAIDEQGCLQAARYNFAGVQLLKISCPPTTPP